VIGRGLRAELVSVSQELHRRGWVANHDGNATARLAADRFVATPTATSKRRIDDRNLIEVDGAGKVVGGTGKPFGELGLHLAVYQRRDDVGAVVHAHPPYATALAVSGSRLLERPFIAEAVVSLGPRVPTVPFALPGAAAREALLPFVADHDAVLIANHGALAWGADLEQAYLRLELVEPLLAARARAGLGKAADRAAAAPEGPRPVVACAPAPHSDVPTIAPGRPSDRARVTALIREEIVRALRDK
jgi:L-fuculose-phosphate aldolase